MKQQQSISAREHLVKRVLLTCITHLLAIYGWGHVVKKALLMSIVLLLVLPFMPLTDISPSLAEIYRWKDDEGIVRYSNAPPEGEENEVLDVIPTRRVPLVEDANGTVYYLNLPDSELTQDMSFQDVLDQLTLPADVLDEIMKEVPAKVKDADAEPLSTVVFRLTELEDALEREIAKRLELEQEALKSQARSQELEQRNGELQVALADMEHKIDRVQKTVALSEIHASALQKPQQQLGQLESRIDDLQAALKAQQQSELNFGEVESKISELQGALAEKDSKQELGKLEEQIVQLQAYLTEMSQMSEKDAAKLSSALDNVQEEQALQLASLNGRLDELELGVSSFQEESLAEKFVSLSQEMEALKASATQGYDDSQLQARLRELQNTQAQQSGDVEAKIRELESIKASYENAMQTLSKKLADLEAGMDAFDHASLLTKIDSLSERIAAFEQRPEENETIHVKLAALESALATLTDAVPASRSMSNFEAMSAAQAQQIRYQQMQIAILREDLQRLKLGNVRPERGDNDSSSADPAALERLVEKNAQLEEVTQQQAGFLALQQERLVEIESKLEQTLAQGNASAQFEEEPQKTSAESSGRITVVGRQSRRDAKRPSELGLYVRTPQND